MQQIHLSSGISYRPIVHRLCKLFSRFLPLAVAIREIPGHGARQQVNFISSSMTSTIRSY